MRQVLMAMLALLLFTMMGRPAVPVEARAGDVAVTVTYTGKGKVDDTHEIWVFLFDSPDITRGARPIAVQRLMQSGAVATFKGVTSDPIYLAVAYDEKGDYDGNSGPPPAGTPIAMHAKDGKNLPITPGPTAKIRMTFGEARRME